jgi:pyridoxamine 5'-phosphate oxidase
MVKKKDISDLRREYLGDPLRQEKMQDNPIEQFNRWFQQALEAKLIDANAMVLSTVSRGNVPSSRTVLLKGTDEKGFRFYTNYESRKGRELVDNPNASLCFRWSELERQVRIQGKAEKMSTEESAEYFKKRPRASQLSAWASAQSREIESRKSLEQYFKEVKERFEGKEVPLPGFWGGFLVKPERIEFWEGRENRLHDRILYIKENDSWKTSRLAP